MVAEPSWSTGGKGTIPNGGLDAQSNGLTQFSPTNLLTAATWFIPTLIPQVLLTGQPSVPPGVVTPLAPIPCWKCAHPVGITPGPGNG